MLKRRDAACRVSTLSPHRKQRLYRTRPLPPMVRLVFPRLFLELDSLRVRKEYWGSDRGGREARRTVGGTPALLKRSRRFYEETSCNHNFDFSRQRRLCSNFPAHRHCPQDEA